MSNHENGHARPTYFTIRDKEILWFIPLSSKVEKYIDHVHVLENGVPAKVIDSICDEIFNNFLQMLKLKKKGLNFFFTDIDKIKQQMEDELK